MRPPALGDTRGDSLTLASFLMRLIGGRGAMTPLAAVAVAARAARFRLMMGA